MTARTAAVVHAAASTTAYTAAASWEVDVMHPEPCNRPSAYRLAVPAAAVVGGRLRSACTAVAASS